MINQETEAFKERSKRRLMYLVEEDFYYLTYNALLLLYRLKCTKVASKFKDYRRIAYLLDFVSNPLLTNSLGVAQSNSFTRNIFVQAYAIGSARVSLMTRLSFALEKKGMITVIVDEVNQRVDWILNSSQLPTELFNGDRFKSENENIDKIKQFLPKVRTATLRTTLTHIYGERGVQIWHD